jgi:hypothetical protein
MFLVTLQGSKDTILKNKLNAPRGANVLKINTQAY